MQPGKDITQTSKGKNQQRTRKVKGNNMRKRRTWKCLTLNKNFYFSLAYILFQ